MKFASVLVLLGVMVLSVVNAKSGSLSVYNSGGYVAKFTVDYNLNGEKKSESSGDFSLGVTKSVQLPEGSTNVYLKVEEYWFPGSLSTIFTESFSEPVQKCYKIWGTTLNPKYGATDC